MDPTLDSDHRQKKSPQPTPVADFLKHWGKADARPQAAYRFPAGETDWTLSTRPHEPRITADQTVSLTLDRDRADVLFDARLSVAAGYVFQYRLTAPKGLKLQRVSVREGDLERAERWSQSADGSITVFLNGPASGSERLVIRGQLPIRPGEKLPEPLLRLEKCRGYVTTIRLNRHPAPVEKSSSPSAPAKETTQPPLASPPPQIEEGRQSCLPMRDRQQCLSSLSANVR